MPMSSCMTNNNKGSLMKTLDQLCEQISVLRRQADFFYLRCDIRRAQATEQMIENVKVHGNCFLPAHLKF